MMRFFLLLVLTFLVACGSSDKKTKVVTVPAPPSESDPKWFDRDEVARTTLTLKSLYVQIKEPLGCTKKELAICYTVNGTLLSLDDLEEACKSKTYFGIKEAYQTYNQLMYQNFRTSYGGVGTTSQYVEELFHRITSESLVIDQIFKGE